MLEELAEQVAQNTLPQRKNKYGVRIQEVFLDPVTISLAVAVITETVKLIKYCRARRAEESEEVSVKIATRMFNRPTRQEYSTIKRMLRRRMGWLNYWKNGNKTFKALITTGKNIKAEEVKELWKEV